MKRTSPSYLLFVLPGGTEKRLWSGHFPLVPSRPSSFLLIREIRESYRAPVEGK